jgi:hypothetical protein
MIPRRYGAGAGVVRARGPAGLERLKHGRDTSGALAARPPRQSVITPTDLIGPDYCE